MFLNVLFINQKIKDGWEKKVLNAHIGKVLDSHPYCSQNIHSEMRD